MCTKFDRDSVQQSTFPPFQQDNNQPSSQVNNLDCKEVKTGFKYKARNKEEVCCSAYTYCCVEVGRNEKKVVGVLDLSLSIFVLCQRFFLRLRLFLRIFRGFISPRSGLAQNVSDSGGLVAKVTLHYGVEP